MNNPWTSTEVPGISTKFAKCLQNWIIFYKVWWISPKLSRFLQNWLTFYKLLYPSRKLTEVLSSSRTRVLRTFMKIYVCPTLSKTFRRSRWRLVLNTPGIPATIHQYWSMLKPYVKDMPAAHQTTRVMKMMTVMAIRFDPKSHLRRLRWFGDGDGEINSNQGRHEKWKRVALESTWKTSFAVLFGIRNREKVCNTCGRHLKNFRVCVCLIVCQTDGWPKSWISE